MRPSAALSIACSALVAAGPGVEALAQEADASGVRITRSGEGARSQVLTLSLNKAAIVDLPADARDVLITTPDVAEAVVRTARRVFIMGRKVGQTSAFFFDANGRQIANIEIRVEPDLSSLNSLIRRYAPDSDASAEAVNGAIVLSGSVKNALEADRILQIATRFAQTESAAKPASGGSGGGAPDPSGGGQASGSSGGVNVVNMLSVVGHEQVLVKVRIVEMSRTLVRQLGVNLNAENIINKLLPEDAFVKVASQNGFSIAGRLLGGAAISGGVAENILQPTDLTYGSTGFGDYADGRYSVAGSASVAAAGVSGYSYDAGTFTLDPNTGLPLIDPATGFPVYSSNPTYTFGEAQSVTENRVDASIEAFERVGLLRVLAEPNLTAVSGEAAKFLAGGEFPVPVQSEDARLSVDFKPFGVGLAFTPVVLSEGRISLKMATEVSELTSEGAINTGDQTFITAQGERQIVKGITIPALQVRRAETTVETPSGGALVLAGLIQERTRQALEGLPGAKDLPVLGPLFRSRDFVNNETELVIIVTPYLVRPTSPDKLRTPADGFRNASERDTILNGRLNALYRAPTDEPSRRRLQGPHGHIIEGRSP